MEFRDHVGRLRAQIRFEFFHSADHSTTCHFTLTESSVIVRRMIAQVLSQQGQMSLMKTWPLASTFVTFLFDSRSFSSLSEKSLIFKLGLTFFSQASAIFLPP